MANGRYEHNAGYIEIVENGRRILEHRDIYEKYYGVHLSPRDIVHHINGIKTDNRPGNLELQTKSLHTRFHHKKAEYIELTCPVCNNRYLKNKSVHEYKQRQGHKIFVCSKHCAGILASKHFPRTINSGIDKLIQEEIKNGLSGYMISKKHDLNKKTVYNHINKLSKVH